MPQVRRPSCLACSCISSTCSSATHQVFLTKCTMPRARAVSAQTQIRIQIQIPLLSVKPEAVASALGTLHLGRLHTHRRTLPGKQGPSPARTPQGITVPRSHARVSLSTTALLRPCSRSVFILIACWARDHASRHGGRHDAWAGCPAPRPSEEPPQGSVACHCPFMTCGTWVRVHADMW